LKLKLWLFKNNVKITHFAHQVGVSRWYVHRWLNGVVPTDNVMERVREVTKNEVYDVEDLSGEDQ
jgi:hypothetical protein